MRNKRGWVRIVEAVAAIMLLTGVLLVFASRSNPKQDTSETFNSLERAILDDISTNEAMRVEILKSDAERNSTKIHDFIRTRLPAGISSNYSICAPADTCVNYGIPANINIYADDVLISSLDGDNRKFVLFLWVE